MLESNNPTVRISNAGYTLIQEGKPDIELSNPNRLVTQSARDLCPFCYLWDLSPENLPEGLVFEVQSASTAIIEFPHPEKTREALIQIAETISQIKISDHAYNLHLSWTHMHSGREIFGSIIKMPHPLVSNGVFNSSPRKLVITTNEDGGWYFRDSLNPGFPQDLIGIYEILQQLFVPIWKAGNSVTLTGTEFHVMPKKLRLILSRDTRYTRAQRCELNPYHHNLISQILTGTETKVSPAAPVPISRIVEDEHGNAQDVSQITEGSPIEFQPFKSNARQEEFEETPLFKLLWGDFGNIRFISSTRQPYPRAKQIDIREADTTFWFDPLQGHVWCQAGTNGYMFAESAELYYKCLGIDNVIAAIKQALLRGTVYYTNAALYHPSFWADMGLGIQFMGASSEPRRVEARGAEAGDLFTGTEYWTITASTEHTGQSIATDRAIQLDTTMSENEFRSSPAYAIAHPDVNSKWPTFVHSFRPKPGYLVRYTASTGDVFEVDVLTAEVWRDQTVAASKGILTLAQSIRLCNMIAERVPLRAWLTPQFWKSMGYTVIKLNNFPATDKATLATNGTLTLPPGGRYRISRYRARQQYVNHNSMEETSIYQLTTKNSVHQSRLVPKLPPGRYMRINISNTVDVNICTGRYYRLFRNEIHEYGYEYGELSKNEQYRLLKYLKMLCAVDTPAEVLIDHGLPRPLYTPAPVLQVPHGTPEAIKALMLGYSLEALAIGDSETNPYNGDTLSIQAEPDGAQHMRHLQVGNNVGIDLLTGQVYVGFPDGPWRIYGMPRLQSEPNAIELGEELEPWYDHNHTDQKPTPFMATAASWMIKSGNSYSLLNSTPAQMPLEISKYIDFTGLKLIRTGEPGFYLERNTGNVYMFDDLTGWVKKWGNSTEIDPVDAVEYLDATERGLPIEQSIIDKFSVENLKTTPLTNTVALVEGTPAWIFKATGYDAEHMNKETCDESHGIHITERGLAEYPDVHLDIGTGSLYFSTPLNHHKFLKVSSLVRLSAAMAYDLLYFYGYLDRSDIYSVHTWVLAGFRAQMLPSGAKTPKEIKYNPADGTIMISSPNNRFIVSTIVYHEPVSLPTTPTSTEEVYVKEGEEILLPQLVRRLRKHDAEAELRAIAGKHSSKSGKALARAGIEEKQEARRIGMIGEIPSLMMDQMTAQPVLGAEALMALERAARRHKLTEGDSLLYSNGEVLYKGPMDWELKA